MATVKNEVVIITWGKNPDGEVRLKAHKFGVDYFMRMLDESVEFIHSPTNIKTVIPRSVIHELIVMRV